MQDNQQRSIILQSVKLLTRTEKRKGKWYGLYLCPSCNQEVELRIDTVNTHLKKKDYPKLCSACGNSNAGQKRIQHGDVSTRLYSIWKNMKNRCSESSCHAAYKDITVCEAWTKYSTFKDWAVNNGYDDTLTIDRIDPNLGYEPNNCRWISLSENSSRANVRDAVNSSAKLSKEDVTTILQMIDQGKTHQEIADLYGVARTTITYVNNNERSTTIPNGSTSEAIADGSSEHPTIEGEDIVWSAWWHAAGFVPGKGVASLTEHHVGLSYGAFPPKVAATLKISVPAAQQIFDRYHNELYAGITDYRENYVLPTTQTNGRIHLGLGCYLKSDNPEADIRTLVNGTCQFWSIVTALTINKIHQLIDLNNLSNDIQCTSTIYDSIYFIVRNDAPTIKWLNDTIVPIMTQDFMTDQTIPNEAAGELGTSWADLKVVPNGASLADINSIINEVTHGN